MHARTALHCPSAIIYPADGEDDDDGSALAAAPAAAARATIDGDRARRWHALSHTTVSRTHAPH